MSRRERLSRLKASAPQVLPSMLLCNFGNLEQEVRVLEESGVRALHLDVMDGDFVPNFTYGMTIVQAVRDLTDLVLDVHLMISKPHRYLEAFYRAGADVITFHAEAVDDPLPLLKGIRRMGAAAGLAINPGTPVESVAQCLPHCDLGLVMSIQPGFGGQEFQANNLEKISQIRRLAGREICLEVDGGVNRQTIPACLAAGAECLVVGSAIFAQADVRRAIGELQQLIGTSETDECHQEPQADVETTGN